MPLLLDQSYYDKGYQVLAGCDEAGRGPLAGPVIACCVVLPATFAHPLINDSKKLTDTQRQMLFPIIMKEAISVNVAWIPPSVIDQINILAASRLAMIQCVKQIEVKIDAILTDAMAFSFKDIPVFPHIKGDSQSITIASASIIAKVLRDKYMDALDVIYPQFGFNKHKGYPTLMHRKILETIPPIPGIHRFTFAPVKKVL